MDATLLVLLVSLLVAPLWTLFECLILAGVEKLLQAKESSEAPKKMASAMTTASSHLLQFAMWWAVVLKGGLTGWVFDMGNWATIMLPRVWDTSERDVLTPAYMIYFGFAWHSLIKDLRRSWPPKSADQLSFLIHHLLTIGLVAGAFKIGGWRAGVLTRLIHDPADIFLYSSKFYQGLYDQGRGRMGILAFLYILNNVVWSGTRVFLYGYFVAVLTGTLTMVIQGRYDLFTQVICSVLFVGSFLMWLLQVIWLWHLVKATRKFLKSKGKETRDHLDVGQPEKNDAQKPLLKGSQHYH